MANNRRPDLPIGKSMFRVEEDAFFSAHTAIHQCAIRRQLPHRPPIYTLHTVTRRRLCYYDLPLAWRVHCRFQVIVLVVFRDIKMTKGNL